MLPENNQPQPIPNAPSSTSPSGNFFQNIFQDKKKLSLILGGLVLLIVSLLLISMTAAPDKTTPISQPQPTKDPQSQLVTEYQIRENYYSSSTSPALKNPPKVDFKYTSIATSPASIQQAEEFIMRSNITQDQSTEISRKFGLTVSPTIIGRGNFHFYDDKQKTDLVVYKPSNAFVLTYLSNITQERVEATITQDSQAIDTAKAYLQSLNLWEDFLISPMGNPYPKNPVVYQRNSQPNVLFVEFHRGWTTLPILNQVGLLNSPLKDQLQNPKDFLAIDKDISASSDDLVNFQRPDQFNTVTVGVRKDGQITYLQYYLRTIVSKTPIAIKPYDQALQQLQNGQGLGVLVYPVAQRASSGTEIKEYTEKEWQQLFPEGKAISEEAVIDDVQLAYEEKFITEPQSIMTPMYIFRGKAPLKSGIVVNFVALIDGRAK